MERIKSIFPYNTHGYIVGKISVVLSEILMCTTNDVIFSQTSIEKNLTNHPDLCIEDVNRLRKKAHRRNLTILKDIFP